MAGVGTEVFQRAPAAGPLAGRAFPAGAVCHCGAFRTSPLPLSGRFVHFKDKQVADIAHAFHRAGRR